MSILRGISRADMADWPKRATGDCSRLSCGVGGTQLGNVGQSLRWRELPRSSADPEMIRRRPIQQNHCSLCAATQSGPHGHVRFAEIRAKKAMSGVEGLARADRLGMQGVGWGGEFTSPSRISSAIISVEKSCKKTTPLAASRNNPSLMTTACRASNLHRAILLPSDNLVNVVSCTQGH